MPRIHSDSGFYRSRARALLGIIAFAAIAQTATAQRPAVPLKYPTAQKGSQVDVYHGVSIADPYRWLEDTDSPETQAWVQAENALTFGYLSQIPERSTIHSRLEALFNFERFSTPTKEGGRYFYSHNSGLQSQSVLYVQENRDALPRVLLDPNTLSTDGTVALSTTVPSPDGRLLGYGVAVAGSDWQEFRVRDVETGLDLADTVKWVKFSRLAWTHDNRGFFYSRYDEPKGNALTGTNTFQKLYYHRIGQQQSRDQLVYSRADQPHWTFEPEVTQDGEYLIISVSEGTDVRNRLFFIDLDNPRKPKIDNPIVRLLDRFDAAYTFIGNNGTTFYVQTSLKAPRGRVVGIDINFPREQRWTTLIAENGDALTESRMAGDDILASYFQDAHSVLRLYAAPQAQRRDREREQRQPSGQPSGSPPDQGRDAGRGVYDDASTAARARRDSAAKPGGGIFTLAAELPLPGIGSVGGIESKQDDNEAFYSFTSFLYPPTIFRYDIKSKKAEVFRAPKLDFNAGDYETTQIFYSSKDGTKVPMFITARKGTALDGSHPTILYGYGGFDISEPPFFSSSVLTWVEMGGIYAVANIRGGGEYGEAWHQGGMLLHKQNVFDDFIAGAEYLVSQKYTSRSRLAINGGSNGGLLVGAVMTQRPDLLGAALPDVGVMDMLRFQNFTIGAAWVSDYGSSADSTQFNYLRSYSPLHNIKAGVCYPPTFATTGDHDDRVVPGHTFKFIATLQAAQGCVNPVLVRIETRAGHGAGKPTSKRIDEAADRLAFLVKTFGMTVPLR